MSRVRYALLGLILIGIAGCGDKSKETAQQQPPAAAAESTAQTATDASATTAVEPQSVPKAAPAVSEPAPTRQARTSRAPSQATSQAPVDVTEAIKAAPQQSEPAPVSSAREAVQQATQTPVSRYVAIPRGTALQVRLLDSLDSSINKTGDTFQALLEEDIDVDGRVVAPRGSVVQGKLSDVAQSGRVEGRATMAIRLVSMEIGDQSYPVQTEVLKFEAESTKKEDATKVGIGAGIGAVIGAIAGGGKGAAIGAAVGGGAGGATVLATRGKEVKFDPEQKFSFTLSEDLKVQVE